MVNFLFKVIGRKASFIIVAGLFALAISTPAFASVLNPVPISSVGVTVSTDLTSYSGGSNGDYCIYFNSSVIGCGGNVAFNPFPSQNLESSYSGGRGDGHYYFYYFPVGGAGGCSSSQSACLSAPAYSDFLRQGGVWSTYTFNDQTRIVAVSPSNASTTATSSVPIGGEVYINSSDYASGTQAILNLSNQTCSLAQSQGFSALQVFSSIFGGSQCTGTTYTFDLNSGDNVFSSSTQLAYTGTYYINLQVKTPAGFFSFFTGNPAILATSTVFTAVAPTSFDTYIASSTQAVNDLIASTTPIEQICYSSFDSFFSNFSGCFPTLIVPSGAQVQQVLTSASQGFLSRVPVGYVTRALVIISASTTVPLPSITADIATSVPVFGGTVISVDPFSDMLGSTSPLGSATSSYAGGKTLRQVAEPYWDTFIDLVFGLIGIFMVLGLFHHKK